MIAFDRESSTGRCQATQYDVLTASNFEVPINCRFPQQSRNCEAPVEFLQLDASDRSYPYYVHSSFVKAEGGCDGPLKYITRTSIDVRGRADPNRRGAGADHCNDKNIRELVVFLVTWVFLRGLVTMMSSCVDELENQRKELEARRAMLEERFKLRLATAQVSFNVNTHLKSRYVFHIASELRRSWSYKEKSDQTRPNPQANLQAAAGVSCTCGYILQRGVFRGWAMLSAVVRKAEVVRRRYYSVHCVYS